MMALILAMFAWPGPTRLVRSQVLTLRERGYIRMALLSNVPTLEIMFSEMMPNMLPWLAASLAGGDFRSYPSRHRPGSPGAGTYPGALAGDDHQLRPDQLGAGARHGLVVAAANHRADHHLYRFLPDDRLDLDEIANPRLRGYMEMPNNHVLEIVTCTCITLRPAAR